MRNAVLGMAGGLVLAASAGAWLPEATVEVVADLSADFVRFGTSD
ncbi:MAG: hypothetical protein PHV28_07735 [Kiritimatiellae bacterium]|nr:hypothetical protein [Kiritimatiellia bacterium]